MKLLASVCGVVAALTIVCVATAQDNNEATKGLSGLERDALRMIQEGRQTFRFDTFGDEEFWGDALQLHRGLAGAKLGGVGAGVSPKMALAVGLKVDVDALPADLG